MVGAEVGVTADAPKEKGVDCGGKAGLAGVEDCWAKGFEGTVGAPPNENGEDVDVGVDADAPKPNAPVEPDEVD